MSAIQIRPIKESDNGPLAKIIRTVLTEFGANKPGTVYYDATTDALYELFEQQGAAYFMAEEDGSLLGGGGIFPTAGLPEDTCELVKMYLLPAARAKGIGKLLIDTCIQKAIDLGYKNIYLETMPELQQAIKAYEKSGFIFLPAPLGNSGHFGCGLWMLKKIA